MSKVETAKRLTEARASGSVSDASTPTEESGMGPSTRKHRHPESFSTPSGTEASETTTDSSPGVRVTEKNSPCVAQTGIPASAASRQMAKPPGKRVNVRGVWPFTFLLLMTGPRLKSLTSPRILQY